VTSNPSGAEILINDKPTGFVTPSRVEIPHGKFNVTIRKHGYVDTKLWDKTAESLGHRLVANLVKLNVAYLDIEVFPPQDVVLYINGKKLAPQSGPIRQLPVPANTLLKIRAENKAGTVYEEISVNLPVDRRQNVQLNPHRPMRVPSNLPGE